MSRLTTKSAALRANINHLLDLLEAAQSDLEHSLEHIGTKGLTGQVEEDYLVGSLQGNHHLTCLAATINAVRGLAAAR